MIAAPAVQHLFQSNIDFLCKTGKARCGKRLERKHFAQGNEEATCPACRAAAQRDADGYREVLADSNLKARNPALLADAQRALGEFEKNKFRNALFIGGAL